MKLLVKILIYFAVIFATAQESFNELVVEPLQKEQLIVEKVFIHTNKTTYFSNNTIWFKSYVASSNNTPSLKTTLLYVNLLDQDGKILQRKKIIIHNGTGNGQFTLTGSEISGKYYIQAYTNFMRNFGDDKVFVKEVQILSDIVNKKKSLKNTYDIQILPEGGHLLENVENVIGIKALINGIGADYSGSIVNANNKEIVSFSSEHLGMTKCKFYYEPNETYKALVKVEDTLIKLAIPKAKKRGITIQVDNEKTETVNIELKTNILTLPELIDRNYYILFHQANRILDTLKILKIDSVNVNVKIDKRFFLNGVNTLTVFDNNKPILSRKFFINKPEQDANVSLLKLDNEKDSINYKLRISEPIDNRILKSDLSISVLPLNSLNYNETATIKSAYLLSPYVQGYIENPAYYFNKSNSKKEEHLDLLLLTQGWEQYSLEEMIANLNPKLTYNFDYGINLSGKVDPLLSDELALISKGNLLIDKINLNEQNDFNFEKLLVFKGDTIKISFIKPSNEVIRPKNIHFDSVKYGSTVKFYPNKLGLSLRNNSIFDNSWRDLFFADATELEEITVVGRRRSDRYYKRKELIEKYRSIVFNIGQYYNIELPENYKNHNDDLMAYLRFNESVTLVNWKGLENYLSVNGTKEAALFIDGERIDSDGLGFVSIIMKDIENIFVQSYRGHRVYHVFTTDNYKKNIVLLSEEFVIKEGYDKVKKYYTPRYDFDPTMKNRSWMEFDWKTDLSTNANGEIEFKIKNDSISEGYLFSIQGFTDDGYLISEIIEK